MLKRLLYSSLLAVLLLATACGGLSLSPRAPLDKTSLAPEFFKHSKRIAIQDFSFAEGVETNAFSPTDNDFMRSVIEAKIVELSGLEVITRENEGILQEEMAYKFGKRAAADGDKPEAEEKFKQKLWADAFVYGTIYEYDYQERRGEYSLTAVIKIVATENGRIWQSKIVTISGEKSKHRLFDKLGTIVGQTLRKPKTKTKITTPIPRKKK